MLLLVLLCADISFLIMTWRQPEEYYQSLEMNYGSFSSFRIQRDQKSNNPKYASHFFLLYLVQEKNDIACKLAIDIS
jgi:hypothetical protein